MNSLMTLEDFRQKRGAEKRASIRKAASALFVERGFDGASIEAIAAKAGVSTATVYSHFGSKKDLFAAVIAAATAHMHLDAADDLRTVAQAYAQLMLNDEVRGLIRLVASQSERFPELGEALFEHGKQAIYAAFSAAFEAEARAGRIQPREDWTLAASQITGVISQSILMPWLLANRDGIRDPKLVADEAVALFLTE